MADDIVEGQEVDLLIRGLSSPVKPVAVTSESATAATGTAPVPVLRSTTRPIAPPVGTRGFVSAINVQPPQEANWIKEHLTESIKERIPVPTRAAVVWMCVGLGVALALAMPFWPYPKACAWWLLFYLFAVAMVVVAGIWAARLTWVTRLGVAHMLALGVVFWGITLAAEETLPRIGYAKSDAAWFCR